MLKCGKDGHYKKDCTLKAIEVNVRSEEKQSTERKMTSDKGGDVYPTSTSTQSDQDVWLIESRASYHITPHKEWLCEYERYDGDDVFLGDDSTAPNGSKKSQKFKVLEFGRNWHHRIVLVVLILAVYSFLKMDSVWQSYRDLKFFPNMQKSQSQQFILLTSTVCGR
jgi:hypothetical protein